MNTWHSLAPAAPDTARPAFFTLALPSDAARDAMTTRLAAAGRPGRAVGQMVVVAPPWEATVPLHVGPPPAAAAVLALVPLGA